MTENIPDTWEDFDAMWNVRQQKINEIIEERNKLTFKIANLEGDRELWAMKVVKHLEETIGTRNK